MMRCSWLTPKKSLGSVAMLAWCLLHVWSEAIPVVLLLTFVFFSHHSGENIIISLTLTAQLVGFISLRCFLANCDLYMQTDGGSLFPNPRRPAAFPAHYVAFFHPPNLTLQALTQNIKKGEDKKYTAYWLFFPSSVFFFLWPWCNRSCYTQKGRPCSAVTFCLFSFG